jgi:putative transposase
MLDVAILKYLNRKIRTPAAMRDALVYLVTTYEVSQWRVCEVVRVPRSIVRCRYLRPDDATLRNRLMDLASERRRLGYRRLNQMLKREGTVVNLKKVRRLYAEERLQVKRRKGRKKTAGTRARLVIPQAPDQRQAPG